MSKKVLLVEDQNPYLIENLLKAFNGFEYVTVGRGDHVIGAFGEHQPVLVLMDIRLPMLNGLEAVRQIRQVDMRTPIIVMSAYVDRDTRQRAMAAGANDFFAKPFSYGRLYRRMVELVMQAGGKSTSDVAKTLIAAKTRRLNLLRERQALFGMDAPPQIVLEIEDLESEIEELQNK